jgi:hypothetical protein
MLQGACRCVDVAARFTAVNARESPRRYRSRRLTERLNSKPETLERCTPISDALKSADCGNYVVDQSANKRYPYWRSQFDVSAEWADSMNIALHIGPDAP